METITDMSRSDRETMHPTVRALECAYALAIPAAEDGTVDWTLLVSLLQTHKYRPNGPFGPAPDKAIHDMHQQVLSDGLGGRPSALWWAVRQDCPHYVRFLLARGANPRNSLSPGMTPLLACATFHGNIDIAESLLLYGAHINDRAAPLAIALEPVGPFADNALGRAARYGFVDLVRFLLHNGANACFVTEYGRTTLHEVASATQELDREKDLITIANMLIEFGADPTLTERNKLKASDYAKWRHWHQLAVVLSDAELARQPDNTTTRTLRVQHPVS